MVRLTVGRHQFWEETLILGLPQNSWVFLNYKLILIKNDRLNEIAIIQKSYQIEIVGSDSKNHGLNSDLNLDLELPTFP